MLFNFIQFLRNLLCTLRITIFRTTISPEVQQHLDANRFSRLSISLFDPPPSPTLHPRGENPAPSPPPLAGVLFCRVLHYLAHKEDGHRFEYRHSISVYSSHKVKPEGCFLKAKVSFSFCSFVQVKNNFAQFGGLKTA